MTERRQCRAVTASGAPRRMIPQHDSDYCFNHDEAWAERRKEWRSRGGRNAYRNRYGIRTVESAPYTIAEVKELLSRTRVAVAEGKCSPRVADSVSSLAAHFLRIDEMEKLQREGIAQK